MAVRSSLARLWRRSPGPVQAEAKASATGPLIAFEHLGEPVWSPRDYGAFAREGFMQNAVVYRSVRMIAECAASVPLLLYAGDNEIEEHPLADLVRRPNPLQSGTDLFESWFGHLLVAGNAYLEAVSAGNGVRELYCLRPDRMRVVPGPSGWPEAYEYRVGDRVARFHQDAGAGVRPILHMSLFHPLNDHYGLSPIEAAATAIDLHNAASKWNKALLDNAARPSGALVYGGGRSSLTGEQFERLKAELSEGFAGAKNAGRPMLLEGGLDWKVLSLSPKDMDFMEAKNGAAREIALALGVPPMLLGIPGDNTYANYAEASRTLWRQTVLPLVARTARALSEWLGAGFGGGLELRPDLDGIEALAGEREQLWTRLDKATFLTQDEKRAAAGYGAIDGDATISGPLAQKYSPDQPRVPGGQPGGGQWTDGGGDAGADPVDDNETEAELVPDQARRSGGRLRGTPFQQYRHEIARDQAQLALRRLREIDPEWERKPRIRPMDDIEAEIAYQQALREGAEARRGEILRDAIPWANPAWGVNRLRKELNDHGFIFQRLTGSPGWLYENPLTGENIRIMERPTWRSRSDPPEKHFFGYYYRYTPGHREREGKHVPIPD